MKKDYSSPQFEAETLEIENVITSSSGEPGLDLGDENDV
jgi:hypothetical protein